MDEDNLVQTLHAYERKVLLVISKASTLTEIAKQSGLQEIEAMRGLQWLENKNVVKLSEEVKEIIDLDVNGRVYLEKGLPERRFLMAIKKEMPVSQVVEDAGLEEGEVNICLGVLRGKAAISIRKDKELMVSALPYAEKIIKGESLEEKFLKKSFPISFEDLKDEEKFALNSLRKRKDIIKVETKKIKSAVLTELGKKIISKGIKFEDTYDGLNSKMLKDGSWNAKKFRRYDVKINVPKIFGGKKQHYRRFLDEVRIKFLALGFKEMYGPLVETEFWNMDSLFMPQFHSARDIHDAYCVKEPKYGEVDLGVLGRVKASHEIGKGTVSKGWQYKFDVNKSKQLILRTHDTAISARTLASKELKVPGKYFQTVRCFRPDVIDASHNVEFYQTGGFVIEEGLTFRHLKGLLKMFAEEFVQTDQIKITPAYFPFTEPSAELHAKHPELGWIELAGSGIFRPEMVQPLVGREVPVIAWGVGLDRVAMFKMGIKDIRDLFSHNLDFLRESKLI